MSMKNIKFTGLLTRKKAVRYLIYVLFVCAFAVFVIKLNQVEKTELVVRTGQTFEKAKVVKILQDNLEENGTRVGEQKVRVRMLTGVRKGEELDITSSSGYLFGAACKPGMKVIVMQSVAGDSTVASVYTQDREGVIYIFALIYLLVLCLIGGKQGIKGCLGLVFTFFCVIFVYLPLVYLKYSPFWTAVFVCFITTLVTMYLIGGPTRKTCAATLGTLVGVILAGVSAWCFSKASGISGYNVSDIETLMTLWNTNRIQVGGLLFSGLLKIVIRRCQNILFCQNPRDLTRTFPGSTEGKNLPHNLCRFRIRFEMVFHSFGFPVAVGRATSEPFAALGLQLFHGADLPARVLCVQLVCPVADGIKIVAALNRRIHAIVHRNEPHVLLREINLHVVADLQVLTPQPGGILYNQGGDLPGFDHFHDLFPTRPLK